ncbi:MAG: holo-ACP synthase [Anaerolineales bacterium]|nr:holo-ACP synthase [Anaerolineales bacterium]
MAASEARRAAIGAGKNNLSRIATGVDIVKIERVKEAIDKHGDRFTNRVFTPREMEEVGQKMVSLAGRFAAKEAVTKALSTGIGPVAWQEIEILRGPSGEPILHLHGEASRLAESMGLVSWSLTLSHTDTDAVAFVVAIG